MFRTVSQTAVNYRESSLSEGHAGRIHGGDRLPWVKSEANSADNFASLTSLDWQVHVYGGRCTRKSEPCARITNCRCTSSPGVPRVARTGLRRNAVYLVRPDGYVALADSEASPNALSSYLTAREISSLQ